jgi:hypothetical protein
MGRVDAGRELEQLAAQVLEAADAAGGILHLPGFLLGKRDELADRFHRQLRMDDEQVRGGGDDRNRLEALDRIVGQLVEPGIDRVDQRDHEQRVAVFRRIGGELAADDAAGAAAVVHHDLLAQPRAQLGGDQAADAVVDGARRERNDQPYRLGRVVLRRGRRREGQQQPRGLEQQCVQSWHHVLPKMRRRRWMRGSSPRMTAERPRP